MKVKNEIFFHVGLPRTASTFLQRNFFPHLNNVFFVKKHDFVHRKKIIEKGTHSRYLLSTEMDIGKEGRYEWLKAVANEYPDAKIIIVLRRHDDWIKSKYFYHLRKGGTHDFSEFFNLNDTGFFRIDHLNCIKRIELIKSYFPQEPLIVFHEELKANPEKTLELIAQFMGTAYNKDKVKLEHKNQAFKLNELIAIRKFNRISGYDQDKFKNRYIRSKYRKYYGIYNRIIIFFLSVFGLYKKSDIVLITPEELSDIKAYFAQDWADTISYVKNTREVYF